MWGQGAKMAINFQDYSSMMPEAVDFSGLAEGLGILGKSWKAKQEKEKFDTGLEEKIEAAKDTDKALFSKYHTIDRGDLKSSTQGLLGKVRMDFTDPYTGFAVPSSTGFNTNNYNLPPVTPQIVNQPITPAFGQEMFPYNYGE